MRGGDVILVDVHVWPVMRTIGLDFLFKVRLAVETFWQGVVEVRPRQFSKGTHLLLRRVWRPGDAAGVADRFLAKEVLRPDRQAPRRRIQRVSGAKRSCAHCTRERTIHLFTTSFFPLSSLFVSLPLLFFFFWLIPMLILSIPDLSYSLFFLSLSLLWLLVRMCLCVYFRCLLTPNVAKLRPHIVPDR